MTTLDERDQGSTLPLILGFFVLALAMVGASVALGAAFVQQRDLQDICDGTALAAAGQAADLDRAGAVAAGDSLRFADVAQAVSAYLARDPQRRQVQVRAALSSDRHRISLTCTQTRELPFGPLFGRGHVRHAATSTARAAVLG